MRISRTRCLRRRGQGKQSVWRTGTEWVLADRPPRCVSAGMVSTCRVSNLAMWQRHRYHEQLLSFLRTTRLLIPSTRLVNTPTPLPTVRSYSSCRAGGGSRGLAVNRPQQMEGNLCVWQPHGNCMQGCNASKQTHLAHCVFDQVLLGQRRGVDLESRGMPSRRSRASDGAGLRAGWLRAATSTPPKGKEATQ